MDILKKIDREIDKYYDRHGKEPKYIIFNPQGYAEFNYEMARNIGVDAEDIYLNEYNNYNLLTVCITHDDKSNVFDLA